MNSKLKLLLIVSLIANGLLAGFLFGGWSHDFGRASFEEKLDMLSDASRDQVRTAMQNLRKQNAKTRDELQQARKETLRILTKEPFDESAWNAHVAHIQELRAEMSRRMSETIKALAKNMPANERPALVEFFGRGGGGRDIRPVPPKEAP
jgi:uncharacterized membrane protein